MADNGEYLTALRQFQDARRRADLQRLWARLTGRSADLLSFEDARKNLGSGWSGRQMRKEIPLDAVVGSVGRYKDFTRTFLPLRDSDSSRWTNVKVASDGLAGLPPISAYQLGDVYFVLDGNHRVSVARQARATFIEADVNQVETRVPLTPDDDIDDLLLKSELIQFLDYTNMDRLCPDYRLRVTAPGQYLKLMELIDIHHYYMSREAGQKIPFAEAVVNWHEHVYLPLLRFIRERGMLRGFHGRTETDLFVWISSHRRELSLALGWTIDAERAALDLAQRAGGRPGQVARRLADRLLGSLTPAALESGPPAGFWRRERTVDGMAKEGATEGDLGLPREQSLFKEVLAACNGHESGLQALEQAAIIAERENRAVASQSSPESGASTQPPSRVHGLHIVEEADDRYSDRVRTLRAACLRRLAAHNVDGELVVQTKPAGAATLASLLVARSGWADLLVVSLEHPPAAGLRGAGRRSLRDAAPVTGRLGSGMAQLLRRCPRPIMTVPDEATPLAHGLLAYDGSPKAREALFIAFYLAARWGIDLTIVTVREKGWSDLHAREEALAYSRARGVAVEAILAEGPVLPALLSAAAEQACDFFIVGGYGHTPVVEVVLGSTVDELLRTTRLPTLVCR